MTRTPDPQIALAAALDLPDGEGAPEEVHVLPVGPSLSTFDGRGPYQVRDLQSIIAASRSERFGGELPIDENHSIDLKAPAGGASEARGWITELQARADGIWAKVRWTAEGARLVSGRSYRGLSPVFSHDAQGNVRSILRAALTNTPNLKGLIALNQETQVTLAERLAEKLGLKPEATEDEILAALPKPDTALQSAMAEIGSALGVDGANSVAVLAAVKATKAGTDSVAVLQGQVTALQSELTSLKETGKRSASEAYVDGEIARKRIGLNAATRDTYVALHMEQPDTAKKLIEAMPCLDASGAHALPPAKDGEIALNAEQRQAARVLGIPEADYLATLKSERETAQ